VKRGERGAVLLELVVALAVLSLTGVGLVELVAAHTRALGAAHERERELWDEDRLLAAYSILTRGELDQRLGSREVGAYVVTVQRPEAALYRIAISRGVAPMVEDLVTVVYRRRETP
jgi:hypothetical protein